MNFKCNGTTINLVEFDKAYPIGSIYMNLTNPDNPATYLGGGTWTRISGRFIYGVDPNDPNSNTANLTGGEKAHALTANELPYHSHYFATDGAGNPSINFPEWTILTKYVGQIQSITSKLAAGTIYDFDGSVAEYPENYPDNQPHNNMPPYLTAHIWYRVA